MSKTVDQRVVEMSFDNRNFEKNVKTSLSTIDKLKSSLNFSGMSKGLNELSKSASSVNFNPLTKGIQEVGVQFNALYSIADQTMRRITNSVMDFGLNLGKQLIIDPKKSGFEEYEEKMASVQTIMASSKESLETVNEALEKLNEYSDKTIYSFKDMTNNIGKFTNAGVKLDDAVSAIKGVSSAAALSGATAEQASRAMYNFAQALSSGSVKLADWKSIEVASMDTKEFKEQLIQTAVEMGTLTDAGDGLYETLEGKTLTATKNFRDTLQDQWLTSEVLIETLKDYADETTDIGTRAMAAAKDVKTFTMLIDTLREAVQSGWAKSFEIIFGDFNQAKKLWTNVSDALGAVINNIAEIRNNFLKSFLGKTFTKTFNVMSEAFSSVKESTEGLKDAVKTVADYANLVDEIISGIWGNGQARWDALSEAGYDWAHAQNLVNERLGVSLRRETQYTESVEEIAKSTEELNNNTKEYIVNLADAHKKQLEGKELNDEELKYLNEYNRLSDKQKNAINEVLKLSKRVGLPVKELIDNMDEINGRWLLFQSFGNIGNSIITIFKAIGKAWLEVFPPKDAGNAIFNVLTGFHRLTRALKDYLGEVSNTESRAYKLYNVFRALFSIIGLVADVIHGVLSIAFQGFAKGLELITKPLGLISFDMNNFSISIYNAVTAARKWVKENIKFDKLISLIAKGIVEAVTRVKEFVSTNEIAQKILENIKKLLEDLKLGISNFSNQLSSSDNTIRKVLGNLFGGLSSWINGLKKVDNVPMYIINGLLNGLRGGSVKIVDYMTNLGTNMLGAFKKVLKIASPSKEFFKIGKYIMLGLILGIASQAGPLKNVEGDVLGNILNFGTSIRESVINGFKGIADVLKSIDYKKLFAVGLGGGIIYIIKQMNDTVNNITKTLGDVISPLKSFGKMMDSAGAAMKSFSADLGAAKKMNAKTSLIKGLAMSMLMIAASMYIIAKIEPDRLQSAAIVCGIMFAALVALFLIMDKLANGAGVIKGGVDATAKKATLNIGPVMGMSLALLGMAVALKKLSAIDTYGLINAIYGLGAVIVAFSLLMISVGGLTKLLKLSGSDLEGVSKYLKKIATSLLLMLLVIKLAAKISADEVKQSVMALGLATGIFVAFIAISKFSGENSAKVAILIGTLSLSLLALIGIIKIASMLKPRDVARGMLVVMGLTAIISAIIAVSHFAGENAAKAAALILSFGLTLGAIVISMKILATIPEEGIKKGIAVMAGIGIIFTLLVGITHFAGNNVAKAGLLLLAVSGALLVLTGVIFMLSAMDTKSLIKGTAVIAVIGLVFAGLIKATEKSKDAANAVKGLLIAMSVLLGFVVALSFIKPQSLAAATAAIVAIMGSLALLMKSMQSFDKKQLLSFAAVAVVLIATLGAITFIILQLAKMDPESVLSSAAGLSLLLVTIAGALAAVTLIGKFGKESIPTGLIALAGMVGILALIGGLLVLLSDLNPDQTIVMVKSLAEMLLALTAVLGALSIIGLAGPAALVGIGSLIALIGAFTVVLALFATLNEKVPDAAKFIESGIPILVAIGNGIGSFVGAIVAGFGKQMLTLLPALGNSLSGFMMALTPFFVGSKLIDEGLLGRIGSLTASILLIAASEFITKIATILSGKFSLVSFGKELSAFMISLTPFIMMASTIRPEVAKSIKNLSNAILSLTASKLLDSIPFLGKKNFSKFGESLSTLGDGLGKFADKTKKIKNVDNVKIAADALKIISEAASTIPNSGGLLGKLVGENDANKFALHFGTLATGLVAFVNELKIGSFTKDSLETVKVACNALKKIAKTADEIPNMGGLLANIVGDNDIQKFGAKMPVLGKGIAGFIKTLIDNGITKESSGSVDAACSAIKKLATVAKEIPNSGGLLGDIVGENDLSTFASKLPLLGLGISGFIASMKLVAGDTDILTTSSEMVSSIVKLIKELSKINIKDSLAITAYLEAMGNGMSKFISTISEVESTSIQAVVDNMNAMVTFASTFKDIDLKSIGSFSKALRDLGNNSIKGFIDSFKNENYGTTLTTAASALGQCAVDGLKSKVKKKAGIKIGENFVRGFAEGIEDNQYLATKAATALGKNSAAALKKSTKEKSPSKLTYEMGKFFDLGFVNGILDYTRNVYSASSDVGETAKNGMSKALDSITEIISSDIGEQPTITPVLDLSNIESGAGRIGTILDSTNVGIGANINAISSGFKIRNQNAVTNGDVVNAIDKLRDSIVEQTPGNTYNLNGISYNDDTPIANAVGDLIRAIEIEGRV